ncbi:hypothetical protein BK708_26355 [Bacillus thuringiensis serovar yunnanensis]|nr:hypothetical protein BK708_26355 [Bacillus thuringiensis serovar yunnanensis]
MSKRTKFSAYEKYEFIKPILNGSSVNRQSKRTGIGCNRLKSWIRLYNYGGVERLHESKGWKRYSVELKRSAVGDVLQKGLSKTKGIEKYNISSMQVLTNWIDKYNGGKQLEATSTGRVGTILSSKGRKTTFEERIEVTEYTIARNNDYQAAIETYGVSYQQIYSWVKKYKKNGVDGLQDRRGRNKPEEKLTELDLLRLENKRLKVRNDHLEIEGALVKKLEELKYRYNDFR